MEPKLFDDLVAAFQARGADGALDCLIGCLRREKRYHELFEALKMQARRRAGLPMLYSETPDELTDQQRDQLEAGLLVACREVGELLMRQGSIRDGWLYLRPVGDRELAREILAALPAESLNVDEVVEVALHEGVDPGRGFQLVLQHYGTCAAITTYETVLAPGALADRQQAAGQLVEQLHHDLLVAVRADITRQSGAEPAGDTLADWLRDRDWLFGDFTYHVDTTHLASTVRFARVLEDSRRLSLALDLTEYGRRLSPQFQYRGEEPFGDLYATHARYFQALLGQNVEPALAYFAERARAVDIAREGPAAAETYIALLTRLGRHAEALQQALALLPAGVPRCGIAPSLLELSARAADYRPLQERCRANGDLLGFATSLLRAHAS